MHSEPDGTTAVILLRLDTLDEELKDVKETVKQVRDHQLSNPSCSRPNMCIDLVRVIDSHAESIRRLERQEARIVTACAIVAFVVPLCITVAVKYLFK